MSRTVNDKDKALQNSSNRVKQITLPGNVVILPENVDGLADLTADLQFKTAEALRYAQDAVAYVGQAASDGVLDAVEKKEIKRAWDLAYIENPKLLSTAVSLDLSTLNYSAAYTNLYLYLKPLLGLNTDNTSFTNNTEASPVDRAVINQKVNDFYSQKYELIHAINITASKTAEYTLITGEKPPPNATNGAPSGSYVAGKPADELVLQSQTAYDYSQSAIALVNDYSDDGKLTSEEKAGLKQLWDAIVLEKGGLMSTASTLSISSGVYNSKYNDLYNFLRPLLGLNTSNTAYTNGNTTSTVQGNVTRQKFADYYAAKQAIIDAGTIKASTQAELSKVSGARNLAGKDKIDGVDISTQGYNAIQATVGSLTVGDIIGKNSIDITGRAVFNGKHGAGGSAFYSLIANNKRNSTNGIYAASAVSNGTGIYATSPNGYGVHGSSPNGAGVVGNSVNGVGGSFRSNSTALISHGKFRVTNSTLVSNLNAQYFNSKSSSSYCQVMSTSNGTASVSGGGFGFTMSGSLAGTYRTGASGNVIRIEDISDRRLKKDIEPETLGLDFILSLFPKTYRMKGDKSNIKHHGFIADEVGKHFDAPNIDSLFVEHEDGIQGVGFSPGISPVVKSIQELSQLIVDVNTELKIIKSNYQHLKREIKKYE